MEKELNERLLELLLEQIDDLKSIVRQQNKTIENLEVENENLKNKKSK